MQMKKIIENSVFDEERALYGLRNVIVKGCRFEGAADGESALKECKDFGVEDCSFSLRYPIWHAENFYVQNCKTDEFARAALWFCKNGKITDCTFKGIKVLRECDEINLVNCRISSPETLWKCRKVNIADCKIKSEYLLFGSSDINLNKVEMQGKYSFQYIENGFIENCNFDTKDAFWNCKNLYVKNSVLKGEYLGWYSENLTLDNCVICGTQPLCYCKNLKLINCRMQGCDLAFEMSETYAEIEGHVDSVKNPKSGIIIADSVGEIINSRTLTPCTGQVVLRKEKAANG